MGGKTRKVKTMKNLKLTRLIYLIFGVILIAINTSSCKDNDEPTPDYVGKWMTTKPYPGSSGYVSVNYSLTLTDHTFIETFLVPDRSSYNPGRFVTIEGSISISGNIMKLVVHKVSHSTYNSATSTASEPYETFTFEDKDFGFTFEGIGMSTSNHQVEYGMVDNQLIIKVDYNMDGIYSENEKSVYTRQ